MKGRFLPWTVGALLCAAGWWALAWLCDDAYIAFRYVRMSVEGHGYVWNPPPFRPVEGYTSFAWVVLLDGVWRAVGIEPPRVAPVLSLLFGWAALAVGLGLGRHVGLSPRTYGWWALFVAVYLGTHRTWLTWVASGLETSLWTLVVLVWLELGLRVRGRHGLGAWLGWTALLPLVRPDGLLYLVLTPALAALRSPPRPRDVLLLAPYALPALHLLWRWSTYGAWLPNTYYAKVVEPWPLAGAVQLGLFAVDHGLWSLGPLWLVALFRGPWPGAGGALLLPMGLHLGYLLFYGGDHFEYRIFHPWLPLVAWSIPWAVTRLGGGVRAWVLAAGVWLVGLPLPWLHHGITRGIDRGSTLEVLAPDHDALAPHVPRWSKPVVALRDRAARWLHYHVVATPLHLHRAFLALQQERFPTSEPAVVPPLSIWAHPNPGYAAYHLPSIYVIDMLGLNDAVIARTPPAAGRRRLIAHERRPPPGYVACFRPNVVLEPDAVLIFPRLEPFDEESVRRCEDRYLTGAGSTAAP